MRKKSKTKNMFEYRSIKWMGWKRTKASPLNFLNGLQN